MNTILISGSAKITNDNKVFYDVFIWGSKTGDPITLVTVKEMTITGYDELWSISKEAVSNYFGESKFTDGAYTQYLDHITIKTF